MPDRYEKAALKFANEVRAAAGLKPAPRLLPGTRGECGCCPIANTILYRTRNRWAEVDGVDCQIGSNLSPWATSANYTLPTLAREFTTSFDDGNYPGLEG